MKKYINIMLAAVFAMAFGSCSKDTPFDNEQPTVYGKLLTASLDVSLNENGPRAVNNRKVRMGAPSKNLFTVEILKDGKVVKSYPYSEMPEIITLPVGDYTARAFYGENLDQGWDTPYYEGETANSFTIEADKITDKVDPIVCKIVSVRVSIDFDPALKSVMDPSSKVTVVVGKKGTLEFDLSTVGKSGYFAFVEDSRTLVATFRGIVEGTNVTESKTFDDVQPGKFYEITFRLHTLDDDGDLGIIDGNGMIQIDANVQSSDIEGNVSDEDDEVIDEGNMRPSESDPEGGDPSEDDPGNEQPAEGQKPTVEGEAPIVLDQINVLPDDGSPFPVAIKVHSDSEEGIQSFTVTVNMVNVSDEDLETMNLKREMDLVNPDSFYEGGLVGLGFPVREKVKGQNDVRFEITQLMSMLSILKGVHEFKLTVGDKYGVTSKSLLIRCN